VPPIARPRNVKALAFAALIALQISCALFFMMDMLSALLGFRPPTVGWQARELIEIGAAAGLLIGIVVSSIALLRALRERDLVAEKLRRAAGVFMDLLDERFGEWGLTPAERDVALFAIKGMSTAEIAGLRRTSEGTVKAQTAAIYRKAGVTGRTQLLSLFIEDLMRDDTPIRAALASGADQPSAVSSSA
jgi:DNA-binding CsgD family transcriptional regulator